MMTMSLALLILSSTTVLSAPIPQGAGVGAGCDAILIDGDTGSGLAVKEAGQNTASLLTSAGARRQFDKAGAGTAAIISVVEPAPGAYQEGLTNAIDGDGTSDSAVIGQQVGVLEAEAGEGAGNLVPSKLPGAKRQIDKAGVGTAAIISVVDPEAADLQEGLTNNIDGDGTFDSAVIGQQVGALEAETGEGPGYLVLSKLLKTGA